MSYVDTISLEFIACQQAQLLDEIGGLRIESREIRKAFGGISDHFSRQERRIGDDLEGMVKLEKGGTIATLERYLDRGLGDVDTKLDALLQAIKPDQK